MAGKRPHDRKPYERPSHVSTSCAGSSRWRSINTNCEEEKNESFISQMKSSVTGLFSKSWVHNWFGSKENDSGKAHGQNTQEKESLSTHPPGESFIFSKTGTMSSSFKAIYPEEGALDDKDPSVPSTSEVGMNLRECRRKREGDEVALEMFPSEGNLNFPSIRTGHPIISSTPAPSTSKEISVDRKKTIILDDDQDDESLSELEDVSLIAHPANETTLGEDIDFEGNTSRASHSAQFSLGGRIPLPDRKRRRESHDGDREDTSSESLLQSSSTLPQQGALSNKRPRFNLSTYGSPHNNSSFMDSSSLFYPGRTMYGGASNFRRSKNSPNFSKSVPQAQVRVQNSNHVPEDGGLSVAAKRILDSLNKMSTPLSSAKRMPATRPKTYLFDTPSYIADFHRHRPTLKADRTPSSNPPISKLLTPQQATIKEKVSSLLEPSTTSKANKTKENVTSVMTTSVTSKTAPAAQWSTPVIVTSKSNDSPAQLSIPMSKSSFGISSTTEKASANPVPTTKSTFLVEADVHKPPMEDTRKPSSFKIKPTKKGSENVLEESVVVPDLPQISFPISTMPVINFDFKKSTVPGTSAAAAPPCPQDVDRFEFSEPTLVGNPALTEGKQEEFYNFIFRQPTRENEEARSLEFKVPGEAETTPLTTDNQSLEASFGKSSGASESKSLVSTGGGQTIPPISSWGDKFKPTKDSWECTACLLRNKSSDNECVACQTLKPSASKPKSSNFGSVDTFVGMEIPPDLADVKPTGFGNFFKKPTDEWICDVCMINNKNCVNKCIACQSAKPGNEPAAPSLPSQTAAKSSAAAGFGDFFKKPSNEWTCDTCLVNNKIEATKCVACETPKPGFAGGFGSQFAIAKDEWECPTCLVRNKNTSKNCLSCSTPSAQENDNIVSKAITGNFKFGVPTASFNFGIPKSSNEETSVSKSIDEAADKSSGFKFGIPASSSASSTASSTSLKDTTGFNFGVKKNSEAPAAFSFGIPPQPSLAGTTSTTSVTFTSLTSSTGKSSPTTTLSSAAEGIKAGFPSSTTFSFKSPQGNPQSTACTKEKLPFESTSSLIPSTISSVVTTASSFSFFSPKETTKSSFSTTGTSCSVVVTSPKTASQSVASSTFSSTTTSIFSSSISPTTLPPFSISSTSGSQPSSTVKTPLFQFGSGFNSSVKASSPSISHGTTMSLGTTMSTSSSGSTFSFGSPVMSTGQETKLTGLPKEFKTDNSNMFSFKPISSKEMVRPAPNLNSVSSAAPTAAAPSSATFSFGTVPNAGNFSFGQSTPPSSTGFTFGSTAAVSTTPNLSTTTNSIFSFGKPSETPSTGFGFSSPPSGSSIFGAPQDPPQSSTTTTSFVFGQPQEKKTNAGFNFGQASVNSSSFNFTTTSSTTQAAGNLFNFQGPTSFTPRSNTDSSGGIAKEPSNVFGAPTQNAFNVLSNPTPHRVQRKAIRRGKNKT